MRNTRGKPKSMIVAGVMSGTSADGADVAVCRISPGRQGNDTPRVKVLSHRAFPYDRKLRTAVLASMDAKNTSTAELARLSWRLGDFYAERVSAAVHEASLKPQLVACHGQTIFHQATGAPYLGIPVRCTWQIGEASLIAERLHAPVVSDFRTADMAAGGQGAPLVPMLDFCTFRHKTKNRLLLNLGGIANFSAIPAASSIDHVLAFDTGPANMIIDACMTSLYGRRFDADGRTAARGRVLDAVLTKLNALPYFDLLPPKSCGREEFGSAFTERFIAQCERHQARKQDIIATATAFTVSTILDAYRKYCWPHLGQRAPAARATELFIAGGGAHNATLMKGLRKALRRSASRSQQPQMQASRWKQRKPRHSRCWAGSRGTVYPATCLQQPERTAPWFSER